jgi:pimeloyl-ACP methyl ester carboxylesterase
MNDIELDQAADRQIRDGLSTQIPQLYLWGEADPVLGAEHKSLQPLAAHQRLILFPQARHFLMLDFADEAAEAIADWNASKP